MGNIAVADDDRDIREQLTRLLNRNGHQVRHAANGPEVLELLDAVELVIMDLHMPRMDGMQSFREIRDRAPHLPVILMTGSGTSRTAIEATKAGAFDYIRKPFAADYLLNSIRRALDMNALVPAQQHFVDESVFKLQPGAMIGNSRPMQELYKTIGRVAPTSATVLIRGETGTGKELVAQSLHDHSERRGKPLVMVNCAAIPETLLESELFGHEKGAFTGARQRHIGKFELANGGSILLDEIGDMPLRTQAKILRVLQDKRIERVGGEEPVEVDVRIFAATHRHLEQAILEGGFRQDLLHRLNMWSIQVPPLRERREDIPLLVDFFMTRACRDHHIDEPPPLSQNAMRVLQNHRWPGNVRELEYCINRAVIYTAGYPIRSEDIRHVLNLGEEEVESLAQTRTESLRDVVGQFLHGSAGEQAHQEFMEEVDRMLVTEAMEMAENNRTRAAKLLGLSRPALQARLKKYNLP